MKKLVFLTATIASAIGTAFGYGDTDKDPDGNRYSDADYYVQLVGKCGFEPGYFYDLGEGVWSTDEGPYSNPDLGYYICNGKTLYISPSSKYAQAPYSSTFPGKSLTVGAFGSLRLDGAPNAKTSYQIKIAHLYLRPTGWIFEWNDKPFCFGEGEMTVLSEDAAHPAAIIAGRSGSCYYFMNNLIGSENAQLHLQGTYEPGKYELGAQIGAMEFLGDNSQYYGRINVGCDMTLRFGNGGFPNATVDVEGYSVKSYCAYPISVTNVEYTSVGVCADDGNKPEIGELILEDGVTIECAGMVTNKNGIYVYGYTQKGKLKLDFGNLSLTRKLEILQVAADSDSTPLDAANFTIQNLSNEDYTLEVTTDEESGDAILSITPGEAYVTFEGVESQDWVKPYDIDTFAFYGKSFWSDGEAPHAGAKYLLTGGRSIFMPIAWAIARDAAGRTSGFGDFYGDELTVINGGYFRFATYEYNTAKQFEMYFKNLRMGPGGYVRPGSLVDSAIFSSRGKITIFGTDESPAFIFSGTSSNGVGNLQRTFINSTLAGSGVLMASGGHTSEVLPPPHWLEFNGDTTDLPARFVWGVRPMRRLVWRRVRTLSFTSAQRAFPMVHW